MSTEQHADAFKPKTPSSSPEQANLVNRCLGGDPAAWEAMVAFHGPRIRSLVYRHPQLRADVEDVKQEVFIRIFRSLKTFRFQDGNLDNWIIRIGKNFVIDRLRQSGSRRTCCGSDALERLNLRASASAGPERTTLCSEASRMVRESLRSLSPELEEIITLRYLHEMSYQEIAESLRIPNGTAKSRVRRGRTILARRLRSVNRLS